MTGFKMNEIANKFLLTGDSQNLLIVLADRLLDIMKYRNYPNLVRTEKIIIFEAAHHN